MNFTLNVPRSKVPDLETFVHEAMSKINGETFKAWLSTHIYTRIHSYIHTAREAVALTFFFVFYRALVDKTIKTRRARHAPRHFKSHQPSSRASVYRVVSTFIKPPKSRANARVLSMRVRRL